MDMSSRDIHIRHIMLYEFRRGTSARVTVDNINGVYKNAAKLRTVTRWFAKFRDGNFGWSSKPKLPSVNLAN